MESITTYLRIVVFCSIYSVLRRTFRCINKEFYITLFGGLKNSYRNAWILLFVVMLIWTHCLFHLQQCLLDKLRVVPVFHTSCTEPLLRRLPIVIDKVSLEVTGIKSDVGRNTGRIILIDQK